MTDWDRVELVLIPRLMQKVVIDGVRRERDPEAFDRIMALLDEAMRSPTSDLPLPAQAKIVRRVERVMWSAISPYETTDKLGLVVFCLLKLMTDSGYLEIGEASALWRAAQMFMDGLEEAAQADALFRSAEKGARKTLAYLQKERLFDRMGALAA